MRMFFRHYLQIRLNTLWRSMESQLLTAGWKKIVFCPLITISAFIDCTHFGILVLGTGYWLRSLRFCLPKSWVVAAVVLSSSFVFGFSFSFGFEAQSQWLFHFSGLEATGFGFGFQFIALEATRFGFGLGFLSPSWPRLRLRSHHPVFLSNAARNPIVNFPFRQKVQIWLHVSKYY